MDFFMSWSRSDPIYSNFFPDCNILMSPANTNVNFQLKKWPIQPKKVIIDSGAYYFLSNKQKLPPQKIVFNQQLRIIEETSSTVTLCQLDHPISPTIKTNSEVYPAIEKTLNNAYDFLELIELHKLYLRPNISPMGIIQGNDTLSIEYCAKELKKMGFTKFGLGSLAILFSPSEILNRINIASAVVGGENLHIFGISRLDIIEELNQLNIASIDSTRPIKAAIYNWVFYSNPFRTYGIPASRNIHRYRQQVLEKPEPCSCPSCKIDPSLLLKAGRSRYVHARAIHNYYHLMVHLEKKKEGL